MLHVHDNMPVQSHWTLKVEVFVNFKMVLWRVKLSVLLLLYRVYRSKHFYKSLEVFHSTRKALHHIHSIRTSKPSPLQKTKVTKLLYIELLYEYEYVRLEIPSLEHRPSHSAKSNYCIPVSHTTHLSTSGVDERTHGQPPVKTLGRAHRVIPV